MLQRPRLFALGQADECAMSESKPQAFVETALEIPRFLHFSDHPGLSDPLLIGLDLVLRKILPCQNLLVDAFSRKHSSLKSVMRSLDLCNVQKAGGVTSKHAAREGKLRDGVITSLVEASCAVSQTLTTLEYSLNNRVSLVLLEEFVRINIRVLIVKADYSSYVNQIWSHVIHKCTSIDIGWERPVHSVLH